MNKPTSKNNAIFLLIVLVAGTIVAISPSFIIRMNPQTKTEYGIENK